MAGKETSGGLGFGAARGPEAAAFEITLAGASELVLRRHWDGPRRKRAPHQDPGGGLKLRHDRQPKTLPGRGTLGLSPRRGGHREGSGLRVPGEGQSLRIPRTRRRRRASADAVKKGEVLEILGAEDSSCAALKTSRAARPLTTAPAAPREGEAARPGAAAPRPRHGSRSRSAGRAREGAGLPA